MRVVVTGASGQLGAYAVEALLRAGHQVDAWSHHTPGLVAGVASRPVELTDPDSLRSALETARPDAVLHLAAVASYEAVHRDPRRAEQVNVHATDALARWCREAAIPLVLTSTDAVFDGQRGHYREDDEPRPILDYGRTKREAERVVLDIPLGLVARLSLLYGVSRSGRPGFFDQAMDDLRRGTPRAFFTDEFRTPLHLADAAGALAALVDRGTAGIVHLAGPSRLSRWELMRQAAEALGLDAALVRGNLRSDATASEPRPADTSLVSVRMPELEPNWAPRTVAEALG